jgi:hypothetical protein
MKGKLIFLPKFAYSVIHFHETIMLVEREGLYTSLVFQYERQMPISYKLRSDRCWYKQAAKTFFYDFKLELLRFVPQSCKIG